MSDTTKAIEAEVERLRKENAALNEQLKLLVMTEQRLYRSQNELDKQFARIRALAEFALHCAEIDSADEIVKGGALLLHDIFQIDEVTFVRLGNEQTLARIRSFDDRGSEHQSVLSVSPAWFAWIAELNGCAMAVVPDEQALGKLHERLEGIRTGPPRVAAEGPSLRQTFQICVPMASAKDPLIGFFLVGRNLDNNSYYKEYPGERQAPFLELLANHISRAMYNAELNADLRERGRQIAEANRRLTTSVTQLESSERRFRQLAENIREVFWIADPHREEITYLSPAFRDIWGRELDPGLNLARAFLLGIHDEDRDRVSSLRVVQLQGRRTEIEYRVVRPDGTVRWIWDRGFPVRDAQDNVVLVCGIAEDVTERRRTAEELTRLQRLETAGSIAGQIAHDFNNLLAPLTAYPQLIRERVAADDRAMEMLTTMETAAGRIVDINQQLLALGRRGHYSHAPLNLNEVVEQAAGTLTIDSRIERELDLAMDLLPILGGASQLARVVTNLVTNACDAMQEGGVLRVATRNVYFDEKQHGYKSIGRGEFVLLEVSDSGGGIPDDIIDRVFDPFFSTKEMDRKRGSGLGLSVVHGVVSDHDGSVDVRSTPGQGSTFSIYFPVVRESSVPVARDDVVERGHGETILLVDDDPLQLEVVASMLEAIGYRVRCVSSGEEAVEKIEMFQPDVVLLDMIMGGIDGTETLRRILDWNAAQEVILISGFARIERVEEARALGARAFLAKPLTRRPLAAAIRQALNESDR